MRHILNKLKGHPHVKAETTYGILFAVGFCHLLNDMIQSVIPAMYPILKANLGLTFAQIGVITLVFQLTSSIPLWGDMPTAIRSPIRCLRACVSRWRDCWPWLSRRIS